MLLATEEPPNNPLKKPPRHDAHDVHDVHDAAFSVVDVTADAHGGTARPHRFAPPSPISGGDIAHHDHGKPYGSSSSHPRANHSSYISKVLSQYLFISHSTQSAQPYVSITTAQKVAS